MGDAFWPLRLLRIDCTSSEDILAFMRDFPVPLGEAVRLVAQIGGYPGRNNDPLSGHQPIWQGYAALPSISFGFALKDRWLLSANDPKNGSSSPSTAAGPPVYAAAGWIAQSPIGRSAEQLRGTMKLGLPRCSGVPNRRV